MNLQQLKNELAIAKKKMDNNNEIVSMILQQKIQSLTDLTIDKIYTKLESTGNTYEKEKKGKWYFRFEVYFLNEKGEHDFHSQFTCYVYEKLLAINNGCSGEWCKANKYMFGRYKLIIEILEHEKEIIDAVSKYADLTLEKDYYDLYWQCEQIEREERKQKENEENKKILEELKNIPYLAYLCSTTEYELDSNNQYQKREKYYYRNIRKIEKITEKTVMLSDGYKNYKRPLKEVLADIRYNNLKMLKDKNQEPPQLEATN